MGIREHNHGVSVEVWGHPSLTLGVRLPEEDIPTQQPEVEAVRQQASRWQNQ